MSADGDHQRTIEAVVEALRLKAHDLDTRHEEWNGLLNAAKDVISASNGQRLAYLYGDDDGLSAEEVQNLEWAEETLEMSRCREFSPSDHRCVLTHEGHHRDDLGVHHENAAEHIFHHGKREYVTHQDRWVTAHRDVSDGWSFDPSDFGLEWADVARVFGSRNRR